MINEKSRGIIVFDEKNRVLIVKHVDGHYGFPKGHQIKGETDEETALREVKEETNCDVEIIDGFKEKIYYDPNPKDKRKDWVKEVAFFVGRPLNKDLIPQEIEVSTVLFVPLHEAYVLLDRYTDLKRVLKEAENFIKERDKK